MTSYKNEKLIFEDLHSDLYEASSETWGDVLVWKYKAEFLSPKLIEHLSRLSERLLTLQHPNILPLVAYQTDGKIFIVVLKMSEALVPLEVYLEQKTSDLNQRWKIIVQCADAMKTIESEGLVWGGINLNHIWVTTDGKILLIKPVLGLSVSQQGLKNVPVVDHPQFLAPEFVKDRFYSIQSDLFAFGVLAYYLLSKQWPYSNKSSIEELSIGFVKGVRPFSSELAIPEKVKRLIQKCLNLDPNMRFSGFVEMMDKYEKKEIEASSASMTKKQKNDWVTIALKGTLKKYEKLAKRALLVIGMVLLVLGALRFFDVFSNRNVPVYQVPQLVGMPAEQALDVLNRNNLRGSIIGYKPSAEIPSGSIVETKPPVGRDVRANREVQLYISSGSPDFLVPDLSGRSVEALGDILPKGVTVSITQEVYSYTIPKGTILSQNPTPNSRTEKTIQVTMSGGFPITMSNDPPANGIATVILYLGVLETGPAQKIEVFEIRENDMARNLLLSRELSPGFQDTFSYQVRENAEIQVYYNGILAFKERVE